MVKDGTQAVINELDFDPNVHLKGVEKPKLTSKKKAMKRT